MITKTGFVVELEANALDDWELMEDLAEITDENPNPKAIKSVITRLIGGEQYKKLKEHCRDKSGKVRVSAIMNELSNIFEAAGEGAKNA